MVKRFFQSRDCQGAVLIKDPSVVLPPENFSPEESLEPCSSLAAAVTMDCSFLKATSEEFTGRLEKVPNPQSGFRNSF